MPVIAAAMASTDHTHPTPLVSCTPLMVFHVATKIHRSARKPSQTARNCCAMMTYMRGRKIVPTPAI